MSKTNGRAGIITFSHPPQKVVSLVPSITASMIDLGLSEYLIGRTDYCPDPQPGIGDAQRIGGPKSPNIEKIVELDPDLVIANVEENSKTSVEQLEESGIKVWVTFPCSTQEAIDFLWAMVQLFRLKEAADQVTVLEATLEWSDKASEGQPGVRFFCPIWYADKDSFGPWWMTFNQETYAHDVLRVVGGENVFANRTRLYPLAADLGQAEADDPGERDTRYPHVSLEEIRESKPELILLPNEPYLFDNTHISLLKRELPDVPAILADRIELVDGSLITWFGTRLAKALNELPQFFRIP